LIPCSALRHLWVSVEIRKSTLSYFISCEPLNPESVEAQHCKATKPLTQRPTPPTAAFVQQLLAPSRLSVDIQALHGCMRKIKHFHFITIPIFDITENDALAPSPSHPSSSPTITISSIIPSILFFC